MSLAFMIQEEPLKRVFIIIPVFNRRAVTLNCLDKLQTIDTKGTSIEIVVIDDGSTDGTSDAVMVRYPNVHLLRGDGNLWWTGCINMGIRFAMNTNCDYILTLNDDTEYETDFLAVLLQEALKHPDAVIGSLMVYKSEISTFYIAGAVRKGFRKTVHPNYLDAGNFTSSECVEADCLPGRSMLIPESILRRAGLFDERRFPHGNADHEFTLRCHLHFNIPILVAVKSLVYTELNARVINVYAVHSGKIAFLRSFFDRKYGHNIKNVFHTAFMHKHVLAGLYDCIQTYAGLIKLVFVKLIMPANQIALIFNNQNRNSVFSQKM